MLESNTPNKQSSEGFNFTNWLEVLSFLFKTRRGGALTVFFTTVLAVTVVGVAYLIRPKQVEITTAVGTVTIKTGSTQNSVFLLSPSGADKNTPWVATGIQVKKDNIVKITASGRIHTSLRRLVSKSQDAETIDSTYLPWVGPEGLPPSQELTHQAFRNSYKLLPDKSGASYGYGMLLAGVKNSRRQITEDNIEPIGDSGEFRVKGDGELMLTVNDIWLNGNMKGVYVPSFDKNFDYYKNEARFQAMRMGEDTSIWSETIAIGRANKQYQKRLRTWNAIVTNKAWNIWYEDNIGSFSVSITVN
jgi:hypothetical protein